jgi:hypothetical protein
VEVSSSSSSPAAVSTVAGWGALGAADDATNALLATLNAPEGLAASQAPNGAGSSRVYVADTGGNTIRLLVVGGGLVTLAGSCAAGASDGVGRAAVLSGPRGLALAEAPLFSPAVLYIADTVNNLV